MVSKKDRLADAVRQARAFRFCGPSDDSDEQDAVTLGYRYLLVQLKRLATPVLPEAEAARLNAIEIDVRDIYSAYEAHAEVDALLPDIEAALERLDETDGPAETAVQQRDSVTVQYLGDKRQTVEVFQQGKAREQGTGSTPEPSGARDDQTVTDAPEPKQQAPALEIGALATKAERRAAVDAYIREVLDKTGEKITRKNIWQRVHYQTRSDFERWQRCAPNTTKTADEHFRRLLTEKPHLRSPT